jgi:ankyrin repeat protein
LRKQYLLSLKSVDATGDYGNLMHFMKKHGAKEPTLSEILGHSFYRQYFKGNRLTSIIKAYLNQRYDINKTVNNDHHPLHLAIKQGLEEIVKLFILSKADIHFRDKSGYNSFETAIIKNKLNIAKILCDHGYPHKPGQPVSGKLLPHYNTLYEFDKRFFKGC